MAEAVTLYAAPMSMYSGKVRSYLRKQGIAFNEVMPGHPSYGELITLSSRGRLNFPSILKHQNNILQL